jgi:hypothetical protein
MPIRDLTRMVWVLLMDIKVCAYPAYAGTRTHGKITFLLESIRNENSSTPWEKLSQNQLVFGMTTSYYAK